MVTTVKQNLEGYNAKEIEGAYKARKFYHATGCPHVESLKHMIRMNMIKNCPVTTKDVVNAEKIFGADIGTLKGKTTRKKPTTIKDELIELPPELQGRDDLILAIDIMYVNDVPFLTTIDNVLRYRKAVPLESRKSKELYKALDVVLRCYNKAEYYIEWIHCDQEFRHMMDKISDELGVEMNYTTTDEHVPEAERNNRTIKERVRSTYHNLPFKRFPKLMTKSLVENATELLNIFPAKGGISTYFSPYTIITRKAVDHNKELAIPFGSYVQASNEPNPSNTNAPRTLDCIYLGPVRNKQGGHKLMDINSGRSITRP
jgi:hypothetical protein